MLTFQAQTRTHISDEKLQGGIGDGDPVVGARPPPQFIQDDQWAFSCPGDDLRGFSQLLHERTAAFVDVVRGSHPEDRDRQRQKVSNIMSEGEPAAFFYITHWRRAIEWTWEQNWILIRHHHWTWSHCWTHRRQSNYQFTETKLVFTPISGAFCYMLKRL